MNKRIIDTIERKHRRIKTDQLPLEYICEGKLRIQTNPTWGLERIQTFEMTEKLIPYRYYYIPSWGEDINVYLIDSGIYPNIELFGRFTIVDGFITGFDNFGHGTPISCIIGGKRFGVAKKVHVVSFKISNDGVIDYDLFKAAIRWIKYAQTNNVQRNCLTNISIYPDLTDDVMRTEIRELSEIMPVIMCAGNHGKDVGQYFNNLEKIILVAASNRNNDYWEESNYGARIDIIAPGVEIESGGIGDFFATRIDSGTSLAAAFVSGAIAVILSQRTINMSIPELRDHILRHSVNGLINNIPDEATPNRFLRIGLMEL